MDEFGDAGGKGPLGRRIGIVSMGTVVKTHSGLASSLLHAHRGAQNTI
jgi:hypothetical protein